MLELPAGELIFSANEICQLLCDKDSGVRGRELVPQSPEQQALVDYWLDWESSQLKVCVCEIVWVYGCRCGCAYVQVCVCVCGCVFCMCEGGHG